ncbi:MAG: hypothetical protein HKO92_07960 [Flavobacteriaceae bacterium]|nr:hypothetical protein [Flavobacteriaceae bacterium]
MTSKLTQLYLSKWNLLSSSLKALKVNSLYIFKPTNPLLLTVNNDYLDADIKIMIFGQETNSWFNKFNSVEELQNAYKNFFLEKNYKKRGGQFWNGTNQLVSLISNEFPNKKVSFIWNNIIKIGKYNKKNKPPEYIQEVETKYFNVVSKEIEILNPDIIVFFSGPYYDNILKSKLSRCVFKKIQSNIPCRQLAKINYDNFSNCYRTYHPNYLYRSKKLNSFFHIIVKDLKSNATF